MLIDPINTRREEDLAVLPSINDADFVRVITADNVSGKFAISSLVTKVFQGINWGTRIDALETGVDGINTSITNLGGRVTTLESTIAGKASSADVTALTDRVATNETSIATLNNALGINSASITGLSFSVSTLQGLVSNQGTQISDVETLIDDNFATLNSAIGANTTALSSKLNISTYNTDQADVANTLSLYNSRITQTESDITSIVQRFDSVIELEGVIDSFTTISNVTTLTDAEFNFENEGVQSGFIVYITSGVYAGQTRTVLGVSGNSLTLSNVPNGEGGFLNPTNGDGYQVASPNVFARTQIEQLSDSITLKAEQSSLDALTGTVTSQGASIQVANNGITSLVSRFEFVDVIEGNVTSFTINANTIVFTDSSKDFVNLGIQSGFIFEITGGVWERYSGVITSVSNQSITVERKSIPTFFWDQLIAEVVALGGASDLTSTQFNDAYGETFLWGSPYKIQGIGSWSASSVKQLSDSIDLRVTTEDFNTSITILENSIDLKASTTYVNNQIANVLDSLTPAVRFQFLGSDDGFTATNATLTTNPTFLDIDCSASVAYIQKTGLSVPTADNPIVYARIKRTAGTNWNVKFSWSNDSGSTWHEANFTEPDDPTIFNTVQVDLANDANWTGTVDQIRLYVGNDAADEFNLDVFEIGKRSPTTELITDLETRMTTAEASISLNASNIGLRVLESTYTTFVNATNGTLTQHTTDIDSNSTAISLNSGRITSSARAFVSGVGVAILATSPSGSVTELTVQSVTTPIKTGTILAVWNASTDVAYSVYVTSDVEQGATTIPVGDPSNPANAVNVIATSGDGVFVAESYKLGQVIIANDSITSVVEGLKYDIEYSSNAETIVVSGSNTVITDSGADYVTAGIKPGHMVRFQDNPFSGYGIVVKEVTATTLTCEVVSAPKLFWQELIDEVEALGGSSDLTAQQFADTYGLTLAQGSAIIVTSPAKYASSRITQLSDEINLRVTSDTYNTGIQVLQDQIDLRVTTATYNSGITILQDQIDLRVTTATYDSGITILQDQIDLRVTQGDIEAGFTVDANGVNLFGTTIGIGSFDVTGTSLSSLDGNSTGIVIDSAVPEFAVYRNGVKRAWLNDTGAWADTQTPTSTQNLTAWGTITAGSTVSKTITANQDLSYELEITVTTVDSGTNDFSRYIIRVETRPTGGSWSELTKVKGQNANPSVSANTSHTLQFTGAEDDEYRISVECENISRTKNGETLLQSSNITIASAVVKSYVPTVAINAKGVYIQNTPNSSQQIGSGVYKAKGVQQSEGTVDHIGDFYLNGILLNDYVSATTNPDGSFTAVDSVDVNGYAYLLSTGNNAVLARRGSVDFADLELYGGANGGFKVTTSADSNSTKTTILQADNTTFTYKGTAIALTSRNINTSGGIQGGGNLSADRTLSLTDTGVVAGSYGSSTSVATFTVDAKGRISSVSSSNIDHDALTNFVANEHINHANISINNGTGITGGGDLTASRTIGLTGQALRVHNLASNGFFVRASSSSVVARSIAGTTNRISVTNGSGVSGNPTIDIASNYVGQTSITTLGTIDFGTWNATTIAVNKGGTGQTSYTDGQLLIGSTAGNTLVKGIISGTNIDVANNAGAIGISIPQSVATTASPTFVRGIFTQATGTAPFTISSTTKVDNLNADLLDGLNSTDFARIVFSRDGGFNEGTSYALKITHTVAADTNQFHGVYRIVLSGRDGNVWIGRFSLDSDYLTTFNYTIEQLSAFGATVVFKLITNSSTNFDAEIQFTLSTQNDWHNIRVFRENTATTAPTFTYTTTLGTGTTIPMYKHWGSTSIYNVDNYINQPVRTSDPVSFSGLYSSGFVDFNLNTTILGSTAGNYALLYRTRSSGGSGGNMVYNNRWAVRDSDNLGDNDDWLTYRLHDGIQVDSVYDDPTSDTRVFWERDPYSNIQIFGSNARRTTLVIDSTGTAGNDKIRSGTFSDFNSLTPAGWAIYQNGTGDFRTLLIDQLIAKAFTVDVAQALAGSDILTKSVALLAQNYTVGAVGSTTTTIVVEDLPGLGGFRTFENGDWIRLRVVDRTGGGLTIGDVYATVTLDTTYGTSGFDSASGTQRYLLNIDYAGPSDALVGQLLYKGAVILDYGQSGDTYIERTVLDRSSTSDFTKVPYDRIVQWTTNPRTGTKTVLVQSGNLNGVGGFASTAYGFFAKDNFLVELSNGAMKFGKKVTTISSVDKDGIYLGTGDYWLSDKTGALGGSIINWTGTTVNISGFSVDETKIYSGNMEIVGGGNPSFNIKDSSDTVVKIDDSTTLSHLSVFGSEFNYAVASDFGSQNGVLSSNGVALFDTVNSDVFTQSQGQFITLNKLYAFLSGAGSINVKIHISVIGFKDGSNFTIGNKIVNTSTSVTRGSNVTITFAEELTFFVEDTYDRMQLSVHIRDTSNNNLTHETFYVVGKISKNATKLNRKSLTTSVLSANHRLKIQSQNDPGTSVVIETIEGQDFTTGTKTVSTYITTYIDGVRVKRTLLDSASA